MAALMIELPSQAEQIRFNLRRWSGLLADPQLAKVEGRVETDRHGRTILYELNPPVHGMMSCEIGFLLRNLLEKGELIVACPISTADGVKAADLVWASAEAMRALGESPCFQRAPEICIEVLTAKDRDAEIRERIALYFDAGAKEVWVCDQGGKMTFFKAGSSETVAKSTICPTFPSKLKFR